MMRNQDVREKAIESGVRLWEIADALGMTDATFSRKLRKEFSPEKKQEILSIIDNLGKKEV